MCLVGSRLVRKNLHCEEACWCECESVRNRRDLLPLRAVHRQSMADGETAASRPEDASGAVSWAADFNVNGSMRSWIDLDPDLAGGCEGMLWTASLVLLRHLETTKPDGWWRGRRVLECSSGTGHLAVGLARLGAHVVATESAESHNGALSSGFQTMTAWTSKLLLERPGGGQALTGAALSDWQALHRQAEMPCDADLPLSAGSSGGTVQFRKLHWGLDDMAPRAWDGFELLILSELYFDPDLHEALLGTLTRILQPGMTCFSIFVDRPFSLGFLVMLEDEGSFEVEELAIDQTFGMQEDDVIYAHVIKRKASQD